MDGASAAGEAACVDTRGPLQWGLGYDGSRLAKLARDFTFEFVKRRGLGESIKILHVAAGDQKLEKVPATLRPESLKSDIETANIPFKLDVDWVQVTRPSGAVSTGQVMTQAADDKSVQMLVLGSFGRKEKGASAGDYLGNTSVGTLKGVLADVFIVNPKYRAVPEGSPMVWVLATDNSPSARHALQTLLGLMAPGDKLKMFYASKFESFAKRVECASLAIAAEGGCTDATFTYSTILGSMHYGDAILGFAERSSAHVLVLGCTGYSHTTARATAAADGAPKPGGHLGSVTQICAETAPCTVLIVKANENF